jgi:hypothetical protein
MAALAPAPKFYEHDENGAPLAGGKVYTYEAGTTTPLVTYTNSTGGVGNQNTNPVILDSSGRANIWLSSAYLYKFVVKDSTDALVYTVDNIGGSVSVADLASSSGSAMVGFIQAGSGAVLRTVQDKARETVSVKDFGATGGGVANDYAYLLAANTNGKPLLFPAGTYLCNSDITFDVPCTFQSGAILKMATGKTATFNATVFAGVYQIFDLARSGTSFGATAVLNHAYNSVGYAEWWGAVINSSSGSNPDINLAALVAANVALPVVHLQGADYYVSSTWKMQTSNRIVTGMGFDYSAAGTATRIVVTSGSTNTVQIGPDSNPGTINDFPTEIRLNNVQITRTVAPVIASAPSGILVQYARNVFMQYVKTSEHTYGFQFYGTSQVHVNNCYSFRSLAGTGGGTDTFKGYYLNGTASISASGGNASTYIVDCNANNGGSIIATSCGFYMDGAPSDTYLVRPESTNCETGINIISNGTSSPNYECVDVQIDTPIIDGFKVAGIYIQNTTKYGAIQIKGGYAAPNASGTPTACVYLSSSYASVSIVNFQGICNPNTACGGIVGVTGSNLLCRNNTWRESGRTQSCAFSDFSNMVFEDSIINYDIAGNYAFYGSNVDRSYIAPVITGGATKFAKGVVFDGTGCDYNEVNCSGINSDCMTSSNNKLTINGNAITTVGGPGGNYLTNVVNGVMA